jgi:hypothetical protein
MDVRNEAVKAMAHPPNDDKKDFPEDENDKEEE